MTERVERTAEVYNKIAADYAQKKRHEYSFAEIGKFTSRLTPGSHIASAGCGTGRDIDLFHHLGYDVVGIDISAELLRIGQEQHPHLTFVLADMRRMPFSDRSFQGIWAHESIHHLERQDISPTLQEFQRILTPGGILFILTRLGKGDVAVKEALSSGEEREYTLLEPDKLDTMLTQTGFEQVELYRFNERERKEKGRDLEWISAFYEGEKIKP